MISATFEDQEKIVLVFTFLFFTNPFCTFMINAFTLLMEWMTDQRNEMMKKDCENGLYECYEPHEYEYLPLFYNDSKLKTTLGVCLLVSLIQAVVFLGATILIENQRA